MPTDHSKRLQQAAIEEAIEQRFEGSGVPGYDWPWVYEDLRQAVEVEAEGVSDA